MKSFAYRTTGVALKTLSSLAKTSVHIHGKANIPDGAMVFVINHFTRLETVLMPYHLNRLVNRPIWSLASGEFFEGYIGDLLKRLGAVSVRNPHRDKLIIRSLVRGDAAWIIFPEGRMVKSKKIVEKGRYMIGYAGGSHPPHTGAAALSLRAEWIRRSLFHLMNTDPDKCRQVMTLFNIDSSDEISEKSTYIIPVNITYYPIRAKENALSRLAMRLAGEISGSLMEEIMTEGSMLLSGVDMDIRLGSPIPVFPWLKKRFSEDEILKSIDALLYGTSATLPNLQSESFQIMQLYMKAIYGMTTVNTDHIFASLLKKSPVDRIPLKDFRARSYLSIVQRKENVSVHYHRKMMRDPLGLLVDDRFSHLKEFLDLAREKEAIWIRGKVIVRNRKRISSIFDLNRARIDNPVAVVANEVEPLKTLQRSLSLLSWQPGWYVRRKIVKRLIENAEDAFTEDYRRFCKEKDERPESVGRPFLERGRQRRIGVLLIHGYMAAPEEVRGMARYLGKKGYWVYAPRLRGHGTSPDDLATRSWREWMRSVDEGYAIMDGLCDHVVVGGFSTGAALALDLASRVRDILGVFAISAPMKLHDFGSRFAPAVTFWNRMMHRMGFMAAKKEFVVNETEAPGINYRRNPVSGVSELEKLMHHLEPLLKNILIPALLIQSKRDPVVDPKGSEKIFRLLGSQNKMYVLFNMDRHGIIRGEDAYRVYETVLNFLAHLDIHCLKG